MKGIYFAGLSALFLLSCGGETPENYSQEDDSVQVNVVEEKILSKTWEDVLNKNLEIDSKIVIEGYLAEIGAFVDLSHDKMGIKVYEKRNQHLGEGIYFLMPIGSTKNHVHQLPDKFLPEDFKVVSEQEEIIQAGDKVRLTVRVQEGLLVSEDYSYTFISIEKVPEKAIEESAFADAVELTDKILLDTNTLEIYGFMEGKFELPYLAYKSNSKIRVTFINKSNKEVKSVAIPVKEGPSAMDDLPEDFTEKDFIVRDYKGEPVTGSRVRVYGTWYRSSPGDNGLFYLEEIQAK